MKALLHPDHEVGIVDEIVEDLTQQDVLPADEADALMSPEEAELTADELVASWGDPVGTSGHQASRVPLEDEANPAEVLVQRGATEAADEIEEMDESDGEPSSL